MVFSYVKCKIKCRIKCTDMSRAGTSGHDERSENFKELSLFNSYITLAGA